MFDIEKGMQKIFGDFDSKDDKLIYQDKNGNKLYSRYIKSRNTKQLYAKNMEGRLINPEGTSKMLKESNFGIQIGKLKIRQKNGIKIFKGE